MEAKNPFEGIKTCADYTHLWQFTGLVILLQIIISTIVALAEKRSGLSFSPFEAMVPVLLGTGLVSWNLLRNAGVSLPGALADWRANAGRDLRKAAGYFGGYILVLLGIGAVLLAAYYLFGSRAEAVMKPLSDENGVENGLLKGIVLGSVPRLVVVLFSACVLTPVVEEVFFRRIVFAALRLKRGFWFSAFCSSLLFAFFHGLAAPVILPVGLYLCWAYERERRLPVTIFLHSLVNFSMITLKVLIAR